MTKAKRIWLKNPQAILTNQAEHGLVIENGIIAELIGTGQEPRGRSQLSHMIVATKLNIA